MTHDQAIDTMLRSIEATWKQIRQTKRRRLLEEQRFHQAYLEESPKRRPSQEEEYLTGSPHNDRAITYKNIDRVDVTINITRRGDQHNVETPTRLNGETSRQQRHQRIRGHQRHTRKLTDELKQYRQDTSILKPDTGRLTRVRLTERPTQTTSQSPSPRGSPTDVIPDNKTKAQHDIPSTTAPTKNEAYQPYTVQQYNRTNDNSTPKNTW